MEKYVYKQICVGLYHSSSYALKVVYSPVRINGNGATIEVADGNDRGNDVFATIGSTGRLILNNLTLSKFNHVFNNFGLLIAMNYSFICNVKKVGFFLTSCRMTSLFY